MKTLKRLLALALAVALTMGLVPAMAPAAQAADTVYRVGDAPTLKYLLEMDGDLTIHIEKDISYSHGKAVNNMSDDDYNFLVGMNMMSFGLIAALGAKPEHIPTYQPPEGQKTYQTGDYTMPYWCTLGKGNKTLCLDGHDVDVGYPNVWEAKSSMFNVPEGASFSVYDDADKGRLYYNGYIFAASDYNTFKIASGGDMQRDIVTVTGGSFTLWGGKLEAGRSKLEYGFHATNAQKKGVHSSSIIDTIYTGSARKYVNGTAVDLRSGTVTINGGELIGRGFTDIKPYLSNDRNAVIEASGSKSTLVFNDGRVSAKGGADCLRIGDQVDATVRLGIFYLHRNDALFCGDKDGKVHGVGDFYSIDAAPDFGYYGFTNKSTFIDVDHTMMYCYFGDNKGAEGSAIASDEKTWKDIAEQVTGRHKLKDLEPMIILYPAAQTFPIRNLGHSTDVSGKSALNPKIAGDVKFTAIYSSPFDVIPKQGSAYQPTYTFQVVDDNLKFLAFDKAGTTEIVQTSPTIDLADYPTLINDLYTGRTYYLVCRVDDKLQGVTTYNYATSGWFFFDVYDLEPPAIVEQPEAVTTLNKGDSVTLTAKARDADEAYWIRKNSPSSFTRVEATSFEGGVATLTLDNVTEVCEYSAAFRNREGTTQTRYALVNLRAGFDTGESTSVTGYAGSPYLFLRSTSDLDFTSAIESQWWLKNGKRIEEPTLLNGGSTLQLWNISKDDEGVYCRVIQTGAGTTVGPAVVLTVSTDPSPRYISSVEVLGLKQYYQGDPLPAMEDFALTDSRLKITDIAWDSNWYSTTRYLPDAIQGAYHSLSLKVVVTDPTQNMFRYDGEGHIKFTAGGKTYTAYGTPNSTNVGLTLTIDYNSHNAIEAAPVDKVGFAQTVFALTEGQKVDIQLDMTVDCPDRHTETHTVKSVEIYQVDHDTMPAGLTLSGSGRITGTLTQSAGDMAHRCMVKVTTTNGDAWYENLYFYIGQETGAPVPTAEELSVMTATAETMAAEALEAVHTHSFGPWRSAGDAHVRTCAACGQEEREAHSWSDGEVTLEPTAGATGVMTYTCYLCGATRTEPIYWTVEEAEAREVAFDPAATAVEPSTVKTPTNTVGIRPAATGVAKESSMEVELDGVKVTIPAYKLVEGGGETNYVRVRDLAWFLRNSASKYDVQWSTAGILLASRHAYDHPNGTEGNVPYTGDQAYQRLSTNTWVDGQEVALTAFSVQNQSHTYYQLRELGWALGFNVGWSPARGIFIETDRPYTDED